MDGPIAGLYAGYTSTSLLTKSLWWDRREQTVGLRTTSTVKGSRFNLEANIGWEVFSEFLS